MRVLVTGGFGFIPSHIVKHLYDEGHKVTVLDRLSYAGKAKSLPPEILSSCDFVIADLASSDLLSRLKDLDQPEWIVHAASETHVDRAISDPLTFIRSNVIGTCNLFETIRILGWQPRKITMHSTDEVYGATPPDTAFKEDQPFNPSNAYAASKVGMEGVAKSYFTTHGMPIVTVRPANTYAGGQHPEKVIPKFVGMIMRGEPVTIYNDGNGARDWLHVTDHARAVSTLLLHGEPGTSYNLAAEEEHSDMDIYERIVGTLKEHGLDSKAVVWPPKVSYTPGRPGHDRRYMMDGARLRGLGWRPVVPFDEGFRDTVMWNAINQGYWDDDIVRLSDVG